MTAGARSEVIGISSLTRLVTMVLTKNGLHTPDAPRVAALIAVTSSESR